MVKITTIIFDIGKVLVDFDWHTFIKSFGYSEKINHELAEAIFNNPLWRERDRGGKTEEEYERLFINEKPHLEKEIHIIYRHILEIVKVYPYSNEWVKKLKEKGYKIYLLSNYSKASFEHDSKDFDFMEYIDGKVISYEIQSVKPEPCIYKKLLTKYNIKPEEAVFLDDVKENIESAQKLGINTILVTSHKVALEELKKLGI